MMKPRSSTCTRVRSRPGMPEFGRRPTATSTRSNICSLGSAFPSIVTRIPPAVGLHLHDARLEQHALHRLRHALRQDVDQIAVRARQQPGRHLDDGDGAAERRVDGAELEPDVTAADDEQRLRNVGQIERGGRIHHARVVELRAPRESPASSRSREWRARTGSRRRVPHRRPASRAGDARRRSRPGPARTESCAP